ncbi:glycosyltransferase [Fervidobacterium gondwanense]|uniref:glycosyltransferase n=1 Tax=Fervidobacterium gondwanense TaxID=44754 RepID=UPI003C716369
MEDARALNIITLSKYRNRLHHFAKRIKKLFDIFRGKPILTDGFSCKIIPYELIDSDVFLVTKAQLLPPLVWLKSMWVISGKIVWWDHGTANLLFYLDTEKKNGTDLSWVIHRKEAEEVVASLNSVDGVLCISTFVEETVRKACPKLKTYIVFNPVQKYHGRLFQRVSRNRFVYIGRIHEQSKNLSFMLKGLAFLKSENWELKIIGKGPDEKRLKRLAETLRISERIQWTGFKNDPFQALEDVTCLLLTSNSEGLPMALIEAIQRGIPVISSDFPGARDVVVDGVNGYLYKRGDYRSFVETVRGVIDGELNFASPEEIAKTAEKFEEDKVIDRIYDALSEILRKKT